MDAVGNRSEHWSVVGNLLERAGGRREFASYIKGALSVHALRRLLRFWDAEREFMPNESRYVGTISKFVRTEVFPGIDTGLAGELARAVVAAHDASNKPVARGLQKKIVRENPRPQCYLCQRTLDAKASSDKKEYLTLEHLWPTSVGGDSVEENLLPACQDCQQVTKDTMSWEWFNIHNLVLPTRPSEEALRFVVKRARYARHYLYAIQICNARNITLKEAFLELGPIKPSLTYIDTGLPVTFFDLKTV